MAPIPGAKDQDVDQQLENHPVRDPGPVTAQRVPVAVLKVRRRTDLIQYVA